MSNSDQQKTHKTQDLPKMWPLEFSTECAINLLRARLLLYLYIFSLVKHPNMLIIYFFTRKAKLLNISYSFLSFLIKKREVTIVNVANNFEYVSSNYQKMCFFFPVLVKKIIKTMKQKIEYFKK